jgi:hypothetical protein
MNNAHSLPIHTEAAERVERGAAFLDGVFPCWYRFIDLDVLNLENPELCILGQLYGRYSTGTRDLYLDTDIERVVSYGLNFYGLIFPTYNDYRKHCLETHVAWQIAVKYRLTSEREAGI